jgi:hypothetical protein
MGDILMDSSLPPLPEFMQEKNVSKKVSPFGSKGKTPRTPPPSSGKTGHAPSGGEKS